MAARREEIMYRVFVTDAVQIAGANAARFAGGTEMKVRFADMAYDLPQDDRTAEEVTEHIKSKLRALGG